MNYLQDKNKERIKNTLNTLAYHVNVKNIKGLAEFIGQEQNTLYSWINRGKIVDTGCILSKIPYISIEWLKTGKGPMTVVDAESYPAFKKLQDNRTELRNGEVVATIPPGEKRGIDDDQSIDARFSSRRSMDTDKNLRIDDLLAMTRGVLLSNTVYKSALASNIRAFHQAVLGEAEMTTIREEVLQNRKEVLEMKLMVQQLLESREVDSATEKEKRETGS